MATRRRLVHRQAENSSPVAPRHRSQTAIPSSRPSRKQLPPYEPPSCPLTEQAKRQLAALTDIPVTNYRKNIAVALKNITNATTESNDRLVSARGELERIRERKERLQQRSSSQVASATGEGEDGEQGGDDLMRQIQAAEEREAKAVERVKKMEERVERLTDEAEKAMRELVDYGKELDARENLIRGVAQTAAAQVPTQPERRRRARQIDSDDENAEQEPEDEEPEVDMSTVLSATEILQQARQKYQAEYEERSMRARYGQNQFYQEFRKYVWDAQHPGTEPPPQTEWFKDLETRTGPGSQASGRTRRRANATDNSQNAADDTATSDSDDELVVTAAVSSLKCPLTLRLFEVPLSNNICPHTFEKSAFLELFETGATSFRPRGRNAVPEPRKLRCPVGGCDKMIAREDCYEDKMMERKVKRAKEQERRERETEREREDEDGGTKRERVDGVVQVESSQPVDADGDMTMEVE
jgi:hypothetical protein